MEYSCTLNQYAFTNSRSMMSLWYVGSQSLIETQSTWYLGNEGITALQFPSSSQVGLLFTAEPRMSHLMVTWEPGPLEAGQYTLAVQGLSLRSPLSSGTPGMFQLYSWWGPGYGPVCTKSLRTSSLRFSCEDKAPTREQVRRLSTKMRPCKMSIGNPR